MREIKFRAWLKETKEMIPVYQIDFDNGIINSESAWRMESEYILEQFTGLLDKNGVEIFEGDIVLTEGHSIGVIRYLSDEALFAVNFPSRLLSLRNATSEYIEVIGNIQDNPPELFS